MADEAPIRIAPLRTERLILRPLEASDREQFLHLHAASTAHLRPWMPARPPGETMDQFWRSQLDRAKRGLADGSALRTVGVLSDSGEIVGCFNLNNIVRGVFQSADAGWHVSVEHVRKGYGAEGVRGLLDLAFEPWPTGLELHRVQANIIPENHPSLKIAARCGFRLEGLGREMLRIDGRWQDHAMHAKLASEHRRRYLGG